jgi:hypothetical protein
MINELPNLLAEDHRYNLHAHPERPSNYNLVFVFPNWTPPVPEPKINKQQILSDLSKLGIKL